MSDKPKALRLADVLNHKLGGAADEDIEQAAAELRRLYAENESLRAALAQQAEPVQSRADAMQEMVRGAEVAGLYELTAEPVQRKPATGAASCVPSPSFQMNAQGKPVQPVAWMRPDNRVAEESYSRTQFSRGRDKPPIGTWTPLYTAPQPQQTEPSQDTPPQHEYEVTANDDGTFSVALPDGEELRIIPPQRKPLTEDEIEALFKGVDSEDKGRFAIVRGFARAIEAAHGIKEAK